MRTRKRFNALELLIVAAVVCAVLAMGVPILHSGANAAVLDSNVQTLGSMVSERVIEGYSPVYRASGEGDSREYLSTALEQSLTELEAPIFVNPFVESGLGPAVANTRVLPVGSQSIAPAVLITDRSDCPYSTFADLPQPVRQSLAGTLMVAFDAAAQTIDVYFVKSDGGVSATCVSVPTGPVRMSGADQSHLSRRSTS